METGKSNGSEQASGQCLSAGLCLLRSCYILGIFHHILQRQTPASSWASVDMESGPDRVIICTRSQAWIYLNLRYTCLHSLVGGVGLIFLHS